MLLINRFAIGIGVEILFLRWKEVGQKRLQRKARFLREGKKRWRAKNRHKKEDQPNDFIDKKIVLRNAERLCYLVDYHLFFGRTL